MRVLVVAVIAGTVAAMAVAAVGLRIDPRHLVLAGLVVGLGIIQTEVGVGVERARITVAAVHRHGSHHDLLSIWHVAAVLLVDPALAALVAIVLHSYLFQRIGRPIGALVHRSLYVRSTVVLACLGSGAVLDRTADALGGGRPPAAVLAALITFAIVNIGLVGLAVGLASGTPVHRTVSGPELTLEAATLGLGAVLGVLLAGAEPWTAAFLLPAVVVLHRTLGADDLEQAADTDPGTGLLSDPAWYRMARRRLRRARRRHQPLGVLLVDIDRFREVNARHGTAGGDAVLALIGPAVQEAADRHGSVGANGGGAFSMLVDDPERMAEAAADLSAAIGALHLRIPTPDGGTVEVAGLTASVGGARFPDDGIALEELLDAAGRALRTAKRRGPQSTALRAAPDPGYDLERFRTARTRGRG